MVPQEDLTVGLGSSISSCYGPTACNTFSFIETLRLMRDDRSVQQVPLQPVGCFDLEAIDAAIEADPAIRLLHVQRSCGYQWRPSLPIQEIARYRNEGFDALMSHLSSIQRLCMLCASCIPDTR